jgi:tripartite ATP-independent transporter DctM subunit
VSETQVGLAGLGALFVLLALRMPVGMALLAVGFFGITALSGLKPAMATMTSTAYSLSTSYALVILPLFLLMGNAATAAGLSRSLFDAAYAWFGGLRGGLASASIAGCAGFAAVSGSSIATASAMGRVALPEMQRYGYAPSLASGAVAAGGTLGILIPPSAAFVVYALLTDESIGRLFMAGVLPGLLLAVLFIATVVLTTRVRPELGPPGPKLTFEERWRALAGAVPLLVVIALSVGGIYLGVFTPAEASGVGAFLVCAYALAARRLTPRALVPVLLDSARTTAMLFFIVIGASVFGPFLSLTRIPASVAELLAALELGRYGTLTVVLALFIVLGTFLETFSMLVIAIPIIFPIVKALGFDPVWFGVLVVIVVEMGLITPPVGLNVFVVKAIVPEVPMLEVFLGVLPFFLAMLAGLALIVAFPDIALLLPNTMFK